MCGVKIRPSTKCLAWPPDTLSHSLRPAYREIQSCNTADLARFGQILAYDAAISNQYFKDCGEFVNILGDCQAPSQSEPQKRGSDREGKF
jgi:hypothetical protein